MTVPGAAPRPTPGASVPATLATGPLPTGEAKARAVQAMFDTIAPRYDLVNRVMTFRLDVAWRRRSVRDLGLPPGALVADLASGTGDFCVELAAAGHRAISVDFSVGMLGADRSGAPRVAADVTRLPFPAACVDGATCGFALRNIVDLAAFAAELARVVRPGGRIALLEVAAPEHALLAFGHRLWFERAVPLIGGLLSDGAAYRYLPRSVAYLPPVDDLLALLEGAGFTDATRTLLPLHAAQLLTATRRP